MDIEIDPIHLPPRIKNFTEGWTTKDIEEKDSILIITNKLFTLDLNTEEKTLFNYTGDIFFYQICNDTYYEFVAGFKQGKMIDIEQVQPFIED
ncbi:MAG TPA: hypothetical protein VFV37_11015 [Luteibaculaceae bacterium]|nr:hypothetical protein [Luteibaculaceae bacterium]